MTKPIEPKKALLAAAGLMCSAFISSGLYLGTAQVVENSARQQFDYEASKAQLALQARVEEYALVLHGVGALFQSSDTITRAQFHRYFLGLDVQNKYPGIANLNFARIVRHNEKTAFESTVRQDQSRDPGGYPEFTIKPPGERPTYTVMTYVEPMTGFRDVPGLDIAANPRGAKALEFSRDTGKIYSSGRLIVRDGGKHIGLAMRIPVYKNGMPLGTVEERRAAYYGSLGAGFNMSKLLHGALDETTLKRMHFQIFDAGSKADKFEYGTVNQERLLFESNSQSPINDATHPDEVFKTRLAMEVGGRIWETEVSARKDAVVNGLYVHLPLIAFFVGLIVSALLFGVIYSLASSRRRAVQMASAMTKDLRESEASLTNAQQMARLGNWLFNPELASMVWSAETHRIFGREPQAGQMPHAEFLAHIHEQDRNCLEQALQRVLITGEESRQEHRIVQKDGTVRWVQSIMCYGTDAHQTVLRGTIMDITERKLAALQTDIEHRITQLVASSEDREHIMPKVIEALCNALGWRCGVYRALAENTLRLRCDYAWSDQTTEADAFLAGQLQLEIQIGHGLGGLAWELHEPVLLRELPAQMMPATFNGQSAIRCGTAVSVGCGDRTCGVLEFFGTDLGWAEQILPDLLTSVRAQLSQYLQRKSAEDALRYVAAHDPLTDLPNRSMFHQSLRHAIGRHMRYGSGLAVMFIDLDRFKLVNDTVGHNAGDRLLQECARRLTECLRDSDIVARLGGDEFAIIVEQFSDSNDVSTVAKKILSALRKPFLIDGQEFLIAASIGISAFPEDGADAETLIKNADAAMYRAKAEGNAYQYYSSQMNAHNLARFSMETALRRAIERNEFMLHFQPKLNLRSQRVTGVEALLRWHHAELGMVPPADFIPLAEESGLIIGIGQWVLRQACLQVRAWQMQGYPDLCVAVNLSARQFNHKSLLQDIANTLCETGLAPECLELEITESMVMDNPEQAIKVLGELQTMGVHLAIDDFGTGYSSLAYLRKLPVDCVKIDRAFIKDIPFEADDMAVSKTVITLGQSLRLKVVAEGVETRAQLEFLQQQGCDEVQGYLFSRPLPPGNMLSFLERGCTEFFEAAADYSI